MKKILSFLVLALALASVGVAQSAIQFTFATISSVTASAIYTPGGVMNQHTIEWTTTGTPAGCSVTLEGSTVVGAAAGDMVSLSGPQTCTDAKGLFHVVEKPVSSVRVNVTTLASGTVSLRYTGVR